MTTAIVDINLLPREHRPPQVTWFALGIAALMAVLLLAMIPLAFRMEAARTRAQDALAIAESAEFELTALEGELAQARALRAEAEVNAAELDALNTEQTFKQGGTRALSEDLFWVYGFGFLPPGSRITSITTIDGGLRVEGRATGALDGIAFAEKLVTTGGFAAARMTAYTPGDRDAGQFTVEVTR
jgi:hypothetical protein